MAQTIPSQGDVVKILYDGRKTYGVVKSANQTVVEIGVIAHNTDTGFPTLHIYHVAPAEVRLPKSFGQYSPVAVLLRQLTGIYPAKPETKPASQKQAD